MPPNWDDDIREQGYRETDLASIAESLGDSTLPGEQVERLQKAASVYDLMYATDAKTKKDDDPTPFRPGRSQKREALMRVAEAARRLNSASAHEVERHRKRLNQALDVRALWFTDLDKQRANLDLSDPADVKRLAQIAESVADQIPKSSHDPKLARKVFIRELVPIFKSITDQRAGRRVRQREASHSEGFQSEEYGPFRDFVCAALKPLNPSALTGVDADIKTVIKEFKTNK